MGVVENSGEGMGSVMMVEMTMLQNEWLEMEFECPECGESAQVSVSRVIPAKRYGHPEDCYPAEGGEVDGVSEGDECPKCGYVVTSQDMEILVNRAERMRRAKYAF